MAWLQEQADAATSTLVLATAAPAVLQLAPALAANTVHVSPMADSGSAQTGTVMAMPELLVASSAGTLPGRAEGDRSGREKSFTNAAFGPQVSSLGSLVLVDLASWGDHPQRKCSLDYGRGGPGSQRIQHPRGLGVRWTAWHPRNAGGTLLQECGLSKHVRAGFW